MRIHFLSLQFFISLSLAHWASILYYHLKGNDKADVDDDDDFHLNLGYFSFYIDQNGIDLFSSSYPFFTERQNWR